MQKVDNSEWGWSLISEGQEVYWVSDNDSIGKVVETAIELSQSLWSCASLLEIGGFGALEAHRNEFDGQMFAGDGWYFLIA
jgi:hypothetical protein